jgi:2-oxoglutarate decarboxylase
VNTPAGASGEDFGTNSWLVEEMYERFRDNPAAVSEQWREFFSDYKSVGAATSPAAGATTGNGKKAAGSNGKTDDTLPVRRPTAITPDTSR